MRRLCEAPANNTLWLPDPHAIRTLLTSIGVALGRIARGPWPPCWQPSPGCSPSRITHHASRFPFPYWPPSTLSCNTVAIQMALESKPLFHPEVLRQQVRSFNLPDQTGAWQPKLQHWADLIASGRADTFKETALLPDFVTDIFCGLLGYTGPAGASGVAADVSRRHIPREQSAPTDVGGYYTLSRERHVEVDGKVADAVLGRFQKDKAQFVAVLEGKGARDPLDHPFAGRRMSAVDQAYRYAFCEDRGLLPAESLKHAFEHRDPYNPRPVWLNFRGLFRAIDEGNAGLNIPAYNGGLFAADPALDALQVPDNVCAHFKDLGDYDYRPAREVADADENTEVRSVIDVDILGHIFEQSITDLERLRLSL